MTEHLTSSHNDVDALLAADRAAWVERGARLPAEDYAEHKRLVADVEAYRQKTKDANIRTLELYDNLTDEEKAIYHSTHSNDPDAPASVQETVAAHEERFRFDGARQIAEAEVGFQVSDAARRKLAHLAIYQQAAVDEASAAGVQLDFEMSKDEQHKFLLEHPKNWTT